MDGGLVVVGAADRDFAEGERLAGTDHARFDQRVLSGERTSQRDDHDDNPHDQPLDDAGRCPDRAVGRGA